MEPKPVLYLVEENDALPKKNPQKPERCAVASIESLCRRLTPTALPPPFAPNLSPNVDTLPPFRQNSFVEKQERVFSSWRLNWRRHDLQMVRTNLSVVLFSFATVEEEEQVKCLWSKANAHLSING